MSNLPAPVSTNVDFPALLRTAIELENDCTEILPGATLFNSEALNTRPHVAAPTQSRQHKKRCRSRNAKIQALGYHPKIKSAKKHLERAQIINTELNTSKLPVATGAHTALNKPTPSDPSKVAEIKKLITDGFVYISCGKDGVPSRSPKPIVDRNGFIIAHIAGAPLDATYDKDCTELFKVIIEESSSDDFTRAELNHKRGDFPAVNFGFTLPNGFKRPINLDTHRHEQKIQRISSCIGFKRISAFQNVAFAFWNPGVYDYQKSRIEQLLAHDAKLQRTSPKTIFPTTACNFRNVCCDQHRDTQNCPFGWCAITALGDFDHTRGGHLILWELKLIIEFPHGYTLLIPSATITHSNIPVADGDVRVSITQYCAGSIFRYVDNGFRTDKALQNEDGARYKETQALKENRWKMSLGLLSTMQDLEKKRRPTVAAFL